ncbi:hypothetical protein HMPREF1987_01226 [Peptostreptococcaceae bacterium oral taxon 113 str. W5053]|nr:hypothetical protein HMPREF1987_01226 [Peptostreptococcaceae bacterium oral taxon 113 str. W5053]
MQQVAFCVYLFSIAPILYGRKIFTSENDLKKHVQKHETRYNKTAKTSLNFKSPNEIVSEYFFSVTYVLTVKNFFTFTTPCRVAFF